MDKFIVLFFLCIFFACEKQDCYECDQRIKVYANRIVKGYPKNYKTKFVSCGENINIVDNIQAIIENDTIGDTIFIYWKDTDCVQKVNLF